MIPNKSSAPCGSFAPAARLPLLLLLALFACSKPEPAKEKAPETPKTEASKAPASLGKAPSHDVLGLTMGVSDAKAIEAWLSARGLTCPSMPSARRLTTRYECGDLPATAMPERPTKGKLDRLWLIRKDDGPVHNLSLRRLYSLTTDAAADYNETVEKVKAVYGAPSRGKVAPADIDPSKKLAWFSSVWKFDDLEISIDLLRANGNYYAVSERWMIPGVEQAVGVRAGVDPHGHGGPPPGTPGGPPAADPGAASAVNPDAAAQSSGHP